MNFSELRFWRLYICQYVFSRDLLSLVIIRLFFSIVYILSFKKFPPFSQRIKSNFYALREQCLIGSYSVIGVGLIIL